MGFREREREGERRLRVAGDVWRVIVRLGLGLGGFVASRG